MISKLLIILLIGTSLFSLVTIPEGNSQVPSPPGPIGIIYFAVQTGCSYGWFGLIGGVCDNNISNVSHGFEIPVPIKGHIKDLFITMSMNSVGTFTVYVNNSPTTLKCSTSNTNECNDVVDSIAVNPGDEILLLHNDPMNCSGTGVIVLTS